MPRARRAAVQVTRRSGALIVNRLNLAHAGGERLENGFESLNLLHRAADHLAVAAFQPPHTAADTDIDVVNAFFLEGNGAARVVFVKGVPPLNDRVAGGQQGGDFPDMALGDIATGQHQPDEARRGQFVHELFE